MLIATGLSWHAHASGIPGAVIAPHEYDLPLDFAPIGEFVEYGFTNDDNRNYALNGVTASGPGGETFEGLSKLAYLGPLGEHLGYELEALVPLVKFAGRDPSRLGLGDPIFAPVLWLKPTGHTTLGADVLIQPAWGNRGFTAHDLIVTPTVFYDGNWRRVNLDGDFGVSMPSHHAREIAGIQNPGRTLYSNVRLAYALSPRWSPFASIDWQTTRRGNNALNNPVYGSQSRELAAGAGLMWQPNPLSSLAVSYSHTLSGANITQTNALYFRYVYSW
jgi:Putative MetA-pathway of phenol degradation